jgi:hypothetical protein
MVCALSAETKEAEYLAMIERHKAGKAGKRGCDLMGQMFGELVAAMDKSNADVLGDLFQGAITYGEAGQYFTPESLTTLMSQLTIDPDARPTKGRPLLINDPCCGTGRMLLAASKVNPHAELIGQDIDTRCARITAINLGLRGRYGWVLCGNSLSGETKFAYRVGSFFHESPKGLRRGVIRDVPVDQAPVPARGAWAWDSKGDVRRALSEQDTPVTSPIIVEVSRSVARVEMALAGLSAPPNTPDATPRSEPTPQAEGSPSHASTRNVDDPDPPGEARQLELF